MQRTQKFNYNIVRKVTLLRRCSVSVNKIISYQNDHQCAEGGQEETSESQQKIEAFRSMVLHADQVFCGLSESLLFVFFAFEPHLIFLLQHLIFEKRVGNLSTEREDCRQERKPVGPN